MNGTEQTRLISAWLGAIALGITSAVLNPAVAGEKLCPQWDNTFGQPGVGQPGLLNSEWVEVMTEYDGELIAGGNFITAGAATVNRIARWDGSAWQPFTGNGVIGMDGHVWNLIEYDGALIAGGNFTTAGGTTVNHIAEWDSSTGTWLDLDGGMSGGLAGQPFSVGEGAVTILAEYDGALIAGGNFASASGKQTRFIARWDGAAEGWQPLGTGMNAPVTALAVYEGDLIAGGNFTTADGQVANRIARWNGSSWQPMGGGMNGWVLDLAVHNGDLIAGGLFTTADAAPVNHIARWDKNSRMWQPMEGGMNSGVWDVFVHGGVLYAGGTFINAGGSSAHHIARWDDDAEAWQSLASGTNWNVYAITAFAGDFVVGGRYTTAGGSPANRVATWGAVLGPCPDPEFIIADGDVAGLIAAIHAANASPEQPATIHLAANGTYTLTDVDNSDFGFGPNGLPTITTEITINGNGATIERSSEPGTPDFRIMLVIGPVEGVDGILLLNHATVTGGQTTNGGGIANSGTVTVVNCTISNNISGLNGGGIANAFGGMLSVIDSVIAGNAASDNGGGIRNFADANAATVINSTITGNTAGLNGGGIDNRAPMTVINSTIVDNSTGGIGGGIANGSSLTLTNSIVAGSTSGSDIAGDYNDAGYNIVEDGSGISHPTSMAGDPMLGPLADNGGPTFTHALLPGSIAIEAGDCAGGTIISDQRGVFRPQGAACDIGAFELEVPAEFFIADGDVAGLIAAINDANAEPNQSAIIHLAENGIYSLTQVDNFDFGFGPNGLPAMTSEITINANGATIERSSDPGTPQFRILLVIGPVEGVDGNLTLNDATITGGHTPNGGGGIAHSGTVTIVNCTISNNVSGLNGGGIANAFGGILTVIDSTITGNAASDNGGGIRNFPDANSATVINTVIADNTAGLFGGGIGNRATMTVIDCTITANSANGGGGGIGNGGPFAPLVVMSSTISNNTTAGVGGGLWSDTAGTEVGDTFFCNNDPNHTNGPFVDLGGNEFVDDCPTCPGDLNGDNIVNVFDLLALLACWGTVVPGCEVADLDDNDVVNVFDLLELLAQWGPCP